jgi:hypothetical protein
MEVRAPEEKRRQQEVTLAIVESPPLKAETDLLHIRGE